jgi:SAM-dependent methyltransferase
MTTNPPILAAGQKWSADDYATNAGFVPTLGADVLALLAAQPGEDILDLGCGDGVLTARLVQTGAVVAGLEPDPDLCAAAKSRGITVLQQDAHDPFGTGQYDAVFSNAALHWMRAPETVIANVHTALRPGGRFVAEQGGFGNVAAIVTAMNAALEAAGLPTTSPWDFPSPSLQRQRLERAGFDVISIALIPRPTPLPTQISGWLRTFAGPFVGTLPKLQQAQILSDAERRLTALHDPVEGWMADYVRLRFAARKPI